MSKAQTLPQATVVASVRKQPKIAALALSVTTILIGAIATCTIAMVTYAAIGELSWQVKSAAIDTFFDLLTMIFFTLLNTIAAGADSLHTGLVFGSYAGLALSALYLANTWLAVRNEHGIVPTRRG